MFYFAIPMIPLGYANDPQRSLDLLRTTVISLLRQEDSHFQILIAAEETLPIGCHDARIRWLHTPPHQRGWKDLRWRQTSLAAHVRERGGGWLMFVDADDLVSRRVVRHVREHGDEADVFMARSGWEYDCRASKVRLAPRFWNMCGTSFAIRWRPEELPETPSPEPTGDYVLATPHHAFWPEACRARGKVIRPFPFLAAMYRIFHGQNYSLETAFQHGWKRALYRALIPSMRPTRSLCEEFSLAQPPGAAPRHLRTC